MVETKCFDMLTINEFKNMDILFVWNMKKNSIKKSDPFLSMLIFEAQCKFLFVHNRSISKKFSASFFNIMKSKDALKSYTIIWYGCLL